MTKVFLTGATGFLGEHVLTELLVAGCEVRALSRRPESDAAIAAQGAVPVRGDLSGGAELQSSVDGCEAVFHVAADTSMWRRNAAAQTAANIQGTANLLEAAQRAGVGAFVHTSSVAVYSHLVSGILDESTPQRGAQSWINYKASNRFGTRLYLGSSFSLHTFWVRATATIGRDSSSWSIARSCRVFLRAPV